MFQSLLYIPGSMLVCFFSRWREYRADRGGALYAGRDKMRAALQKLQTLTQNPGSFSRDQAAAQDSYSYFKINPSQRRASRWTYLFSSHPPLKDRIQRLSRPFY